MQIADRVRWSLGDREDLQQSGASGSGRPLVRTSKASRKGISIRLSYSSRSPRRLPTGQLLAGECEFNSRQSWFNRVGTPVNAARVIQAPLEDGSNSLQKMGFCVKACLILHDKTGNPGRGNLGHLMGPAKWGACGNKGSYGSAT